MFTSGKDNINVQLENTSKDVARAVGKTAQEICIEGESAFNRAITSTRAQIPRRIDAIRKVNCHSVSIYLLNTFG